MAWWSSGFRFKTRRGFFDRPVFLQSRELNLSQDREESVTPSAANLQAGAPTLVSRLGLADIAAAERAERTDRVGIVEIMSTGMAEPELVEHVERASHHVGVGLAMVAAVAGLDDLGTLSLLLRSQHESPDKSAGGQDAPGERRRRWFDLFVGCL